MTSSTWQKIVEGKKADREQKDRTRRNLVQRLGHKVLSLGEQMVLAIFDDLVAKNLLVWVKPSGHEYVENWSKGKYSQYWVVERISISRRSLIHVGHTEPLGNIEANQTEKGDWEQDGHSRAKNERYVGHCQYERVLVVNTKNASRVQVYELLDWLAPTLLWIAHMKRLLIQHSINVPYEPVNGEFNRRHEYVEGHGFAD